MFRLSRFVDELLATDTNTKHQLFSVCPDVYRSHIDRLPAHLMNPRNCEVNHWCVGHFQYTVGLYCGFASASLFLQLAVSRCAFVALSRTLRQLRTAAPVFFFAAIASSTWLISAQKASLMRALTDVSLTPTMEDIARYGVRHQLRASKKTAVFRYDSRQAAGKPKEPLEVALHEAALRGGLLTGEFALE